MSKEEMKKEIPKGTFYCDGCPWWKFIRIDKLHINPPSKEFIQCEHIDCEHKHLCWTTPSTSCSRRVIQCEYLGLLDENEDSLLWDKCKECNIGCE